MKRAKWPGTLPKKKSQKTRSIFYFYLRNIPRIQNRKPIAEQDKENTHDTANQTFKVWVDAFSDALYSRALYKTSDREVAEDLVQETFVAAYKSFEKFRRDSSPKTWLLSILNHKIVDYYRKSGRSPQEIAWDKLPEAGKITERTFNENGRWKAQAEPLPWDDAAALTDDPEFKNILDHCMDELPEDWSGAVRAKYIHSKKGAEICQDMHISSTNYWQIIHRAKLFLRECLEKLWFKK